VTPPAGSLDEADRLESLIGFFENLDRAGLQRIGEFYAPGAWFKDPFNEVTGVAAIASIFDEMFVRLDEPRFVILARLAQRDQAFLVWELEFRFRGAPVAAAQRIRGASHLHFDADGRVIRHRDYWDAAEELYEKLPLLGIAMRWLKRRVRG
jgi:steroid Delta-isomerase